MALDVLDDFVFLNHAGLELLADLVGDFLCHVDAHVDLDQLFKQIVVERFIDQPPLLEEVADVGVQQLRGLFQTLF